MTVSPAVSPSQFGLSTSPPTKIFHKNKYVPASFKLFTHNSLQPETCVFKVVQLGFLVLNNFVKSFDPIVLLRIVFKLV